METKELELIELTFDNINKAYEIDRTDIPYDFVEDVQTLSDIMKYGSDNNLIGHAYLAEYGGKPIGTIMLGEGIVGDADPEELQNRPFYRLMFFVLDKNYRGNGLGAEMMEEAISRIYKEFGERPILLEVQQSNEKAARFYEKNGFIKTTYSVGNDNYFVRGL